FVLGVVATWFLLRPEGVALPGLVEIKRETPAAEAPEVATAAALDVDREDLDERISQMEQRLARIDLQAEAAAGNAVRAEGLLIVTRRDDTPSPAPERRIERARRFLQSGRAGAAAGEVRNLPNADQAADWIADAERFSAAQRGLEVLEAAAILEPRELRDGAGQPVAPPSPPPATE